MKAKMNNKQIQMQYNSLSDEEKIKRLEFWAKLYLQWLDLGADVVEGELQADVIVAYPEVTEALYAERMEE